MKLLEYGRIEVDGLVYGSHDTERHEFGDHLIGFNPHPLYQLSQNNGIIDFYTTLDGLGGGDKGV